MEARMIERLEEEIGVMNTNLERIKALHQRGGGHRNGKRMEEAVHQIRIAVDIAENLISQSGFGRRA